MDNILGWIATILLTTYSIPQIVKIIKRRSVEDISIWMWSLYLVGHIVAIFYAVLINQNPLIIKYAISIVTSIIVIIVYFKYNK